jgi:ribose-phosphate pyrophosphokinase
MIRLNSTVIQPTKFPNGETKIGHAHILKAILPGRNVVHFKYETDADLIDLYFVKSFLDTYKLDLSLVIYYMPYSRMDRVEDHSAFTLKYVTNFINHMEFPRVKVIEPHSDVTTALLNNVEAHYVNFELVEYVKAAVEFDINQDYIMFPDAGAAKRYSKMKARNVIIGNKVRNFETGEILGLDLSCGNETKSKKVIIVDDLSSYGGTFVHSAKRLREEGFEEIYLLVAHAENVIFKGELFDHITKVFTTDSMLTDHVKAANIKQIGDQLKVYRLGELI